MKRYKWITKGGNEVFVDEMEDSHLLNAYRLMSERSKLLSKAISSMYSLSCGMNGEMALDQIDREIADAEEAEFNLDATKKVLFMEIEKRGLKPLPLRTTEPSDNSNQTLNQFHVDPV